MYTFRPPGHCHSGNLVSVEITFYCLYLLLTDTYEDRREKVGCDKKTPTLQCNSRKSRIISWKSHVFSSYGPTLIVLLHSDKLEAACGKPGLYKYYGRSKGTSIGTEKFSVSWVITYGIILLSVSYISNKNKELHYFIFYWKVIFWSLNTCGFHPDFIDISLVNPDMVLFVDISRSGLARSQERHMFSFNT